LKVVHRQRVQRYGDAEPMPEFAATDVAADLLGPAADGWQRLIDTEYESVVIAGWMTAALARLGAPLDLCGAFGRIVEDELRHVDLCAQMVESFGGVPEIPLAAPPPFPSALAETPESEREIIGGLVSFFCVFEHLSGHVFRHAIEVAELPKAKWALSEIFRDEAFHGAFGFEAAKHFVPRWSEEHREALATRVAGDIRRFGDRLGIGKPAPSDPRIARLIDLGLLTGEALQATYTHGVVGDLIPRLSEDLDVHIVLA
jgi:hypothetical protein